MRFDVSIPLTGHGAFEVARQLFQRLTSGRAGVWEEK